MDEPIVQIGRHDAHLRSQLEDIPAVVAEQANRRRVVFRSAKAFALHCAGFAVHCGAFVVHRGAIAVHQGIQLQRQQPHERRLARAVGTQDGGVFADVDGQREVVEDPRGTEDDRRAEQLQERLWVGRFSLQTSCFQLLTF